MAFICADVFSLSFFIIFFVVVCLFKWKWTVDMLQLLHAHCTVHTRVKWFCILVVVIFDPQCMDLSRTGEKKKIFLSSFGISFPWLLYPNRLYIYIWNSFQSSRTKDLVGTLPIFRYNWKHHIPLFRDIYRDPI